MSAMKLSVGVAIAIFTSLSTAFAQVRSATIGGVVSVAAPGGAPLTMPGVSITLSCGPGAAQLTDITNEQGTFRFTQVPVGDCTVVATLEGFKAATKALSTRANEENGVDLLLDLDTIHEEVNVSGDANQADANSMAGHAERLTTKDMQTAPLASERFQAALPLIPGVVRGPDGLLNINGTRSNQAALMFSNASGTDPVTGEDAIELPIDAVRSVQVRGTAYAPEFGQTVGAVTTVETQGGGDAWHFQVNDLEPRPRRRGGVFRGIESFTPRLTVGGPVVKRKLSVIQSGQYELLQTRVSSLPPFQSDTKLRGFDSFSRADWTIDQANHLTGSATVSRRKTTYAGLNTFNPQSVTPNIRKDSVLGTATDQTVISSHGVLDTRISVKQYDVSIDPSQGSAAMVLGPDVNSGSYFNDQDRNSRRIEWLSTYAFTPVGPAHLLKAGVGITYETFDGTSSSRPVEIVRESGTTSEVTTFVGGTALRKNRTSVTGYAQDTWTLSPRLTAEYGARYDYDSVNGKVNLAPRGSFAALVTGDGRTVVRGGAGIFYALNPLNVASFDQLQDRIVTSFDTDGVTPTSVPTLIRNVTAQDLRSPRSVNWNVEVDREWIRNLFIRVGYQQRDNRYEALLNPATLSDGGPILQLRDDGRSRYRQGQVTARYQFHGADQIVGSYTRSSAIGNLNDFNTYFGNIQNPVIRPDERGRLPWDAPNRFLFWTNVTLPNGFSVFPVLDVRTGFPSSITDENRDFVGARNSNRYPRFVSLDAQLMKRLRIFHHNATIGLKVFNITNHFNPRDYQGNLASAEFGGFFNSVGRTFRGKWVFEF